MILTTGTALKYSAWPWLLVRSNTPSLLPCYCCPNTENKQIDGACVDELLIESVSTDTFVFDRPGKMKL